MTSKYLALLLVLLLPVYAIDAKLSKEREGIDSISNLDNSPKAEPSSKCLAAGRSLEKLNGRQFTILAAQRFRGHFSSY